MEDISDNIEELLELDTAWIDELEQQDISYNNFYKEVVDKINIFYIYINNNNNIYNIKKDLLPIAKLIAAIAIFESSILCFSLRVSRISIIKAFFSSLLF